MRRLSRLFGKKPIDKRLYDEADPDLVESIFSQLLADAPGGMSASSVPSGNPSPPAGGVEPSSGADFPSCGTTVPGVTAKCAGDINPERERDWRWLNAFPIPHSQKVIGDD
ncbi:hypothetical protein IC614_02955 [Allosphingosinicella flava]|uniref:Uncharacterized protein n=1 Tax=Allosphingosinicella flava TaxID=2771430 RepID=A0A7T2GKQ8_9SPHN|nr:hypothetical protein [Sphingosinicella flava]QPQ55577.1 hypothetical protein IC614_02955 [Sphingosinicella flava]